MGMPFELVFMKWAIAEEEGGAIMILLIPQFVFHFVGGLEVDEKWGGSRVEEVLGCRRALRTCLDL